MAQLTLDVGTNANDGTGDTLRAAMVKVNTNFTELYASPLIASGISVTGNEIKASRSNDDLVLTPSGTGAVTISNLTIDSNINLTDNKIKTTVSNSNLELSASGTGNIVINPVDINGGAIDNTIIGAATPLAGTFTTMTANTSAIIDGVTIIDNTVSSNASNANLELSGSGSGGVTVSGITFPTSDGSNGQYLKTDGAGTLSFATLSAGTTLNYSDIADATTTVATSATSVMSSFAHATYRSAKYFISITDATNTRYEIVEANVTHNGTTAYISTFGRATNYTGDLATFSAAINGSNVEVRVTNITSDSIVFKFQIITIDV
jgi:hypothetical protein|tara:strand:- start:127 stop:1089 length:963 start_codon:yes stop_codon:yes gene_type:complete